MILRHSGRVGTRCPYQVEGDGNMCGLVSGEPGAGCVSILAAASRPRPWSWLRHLHLNCGHQEENLPSSELSSGFSGASVLGRLLGWAD